MSNTTKKPRAWSETLNKTTVWQYENRRQFLETTIITVAPAYYQAWKGTHIRT